MTTIPRQSIRVRMSDDLHKLIGMYAKDTGRSIGELVALSLIATQGDGLKDMAIKLGRSEVLHEIEELKNDIQQ